MLFLQKAGPFSGEQKKSRRLFTFGRRVEQLGGPRELTHITIIPKCLGSRPIWIHVWCIYLHENHKNQPFM